MVPVPESVTVCGLPLALSMTVIVPGTLPTLVGANVTLIVQEAEDVSVDTQLLFWLYCDDAVRLEIIKLAPPVF